MKKIISIIILLLLICAAGAYYVLANQEGDVINMENKKVLVAYYSHSGNTEDLAKKIQKITNADLFEIIPKTPYSKDYNTVVAQAQKEKENNYMPELVSNGDTKNYDIIFVGTPVWWYTMASPVKTFLAKNDFTGKTIVPFCTHGGGGASMTYTDMQKIAPDAKVLQGFASYERTAKDSEVADWIKSLKL